MKKLLIVIGMILTSITSAQTLVASSPIMKSYPTAVHLFIKEMVTRYHWQENKLSTLFQQVDSLPTVLEKIQAPYEEKPWSVYHDHFMQPERITLGKQFLQTHAKTLQNIQQKTGVSAAIIVAILGVETKYGLQERPYRAIDALATLAFGYPKRAAFFKKELVEFLLLTRAHHLNPLLLRSSYAGAIGLPQFMPSSYNTYAIGFDHQGHVDLDHNVNDAMMSIANYFKKNGWIANEPIAIRAKVTGEAYRAIVINKVKKPLYLLSHLQALGITPITPLPKNLKANLISLKNANGTTEYWLALQNFYVITRYNTSLLYAMVVRELGEKIT